MKTICLKFHITEDEYRELDKQFGKLCYYAAHQLKKKNSRNNYTDDIDDICQDLQMAIIRAGSYTKRQVYIQKCLALAAEYARDDFMCNIVASLQDLWKNRTRHGANRQKFGPYQEQILDRICQAIVPRHLRPSKKDKLVINDKFKTYCKSIVWNEQKARGKRITREKAIRSGQVSLSDYDFLIAN